jgi:hypothetical protein
MKVECGLLVASFAAVTYAQQPTPAPTPPRSPLQFQEVVTVEGATRDQLYNSALAWFPEAFRSGKAVLQVQNKEAGQLVGAASERYVSPVFMSGSCITGSLHYHVAVEVKDGRYRYTVDGFEHEGGTPACKMVGISFGLLTTDRTCPRNVTGVFPGSKETIWNDLKAKAAALAEVLKKSLRAKLATVATEKPW